MGKHTIRLLFREKMNSRGVDENTGAIPYWVRGDDLEIQVAHENHDGSYLKRADVGELEYVVRDAGSSPTAPKRMSKVVLQSECSATFVAEDWLGGSGELATVSWRLGECSLEVPSGQSAQNYFIYAVHISPLGFRTTYGPITVEVRAVHAALTISPPVPVQTAEEFLESTLDLIRSLESRIAFLEGEHGISRDGPVTIGGDEVTIGGDEVSI